MQIAAFSKVFITIITIITLQSFHMFSMAFPESSVGFRGFGSPGSCQSLGKGLNSQEFYEDLMVMATSSGKDATIMEFYNS